MGRHSTLVTDPAEEIPAVLPMPEINNGPGVQSLDNELDTLLDNLKAHKGYSVQLFRLGEDGEKVFVRKYNITQFSVDQVANESGGGKYEISVHDAGGKIKTRKTFDIDPRRQGSMDAKPVTALAAPQTLPVQFGQGDSALNLMLQMMQQNAKETKEASNETMKMFMAMMMANQQSQNQLIAAIMARPVSDGGSDRSTQFIDSVMPLLLKKEDVAHHGTRGGDPLAQVEKVLELIDRLKERGESGENEDSMSFGSILKPLAAALAPAAMQLMQRASGQPQPQPAARPAIDVNAPPPQAQAQPSLRDAVIMGVRNYRPLLLMAAHRGKDPISVVDMIELQATQEQLDVLEGVIAEENWLQVLFPDDAEILAVKPWFDSFKVAFLDLPDQPVEVTPSAPAKIKKGKAVPAAEVPNGN